MRLEVYGAAEAARLLGVTNVTISRWIRDGRLVPDAYLSCGPIFRRATLEKVRR